MPPLLELLVRYVGLVISVCCVLLIAHHFFTRKDGES